jgi:hypothetical protein
MISETQFISLELDPYRVVHGDDPRTLPVVVDDG